MTFGEAISLIGLAVTIVVVISGFVGWVVRTLWKAAKLLVTTTAALESLQDRMEKFEQRLSRLEGKHAECDG